MTAPYTLDEAAAELGITPRHLRDLIDESQIAAFDVRSPGASRPALRIERREIEAFKARRKVEPCRREERAPAASKGSGGTKPRTAGTTTSVFPGIDFAARVAQRRAAKQSATSRASGGRQPRRSAKVLALSP